MEERKYTTEMEEYEGIILQSIKLAVWKKTVDQWWPMGEVVWRLNLTKGESLPW